MFWAACDGTIYETGGYFAPLGPSLVLEQSTQVSMTRRRTVWYFNPTDKEWRLVQQSGGGTDRDSSVDYASAPDLDLHFAGGDITSAQHQPEDKHYPLGSGLSSCMVNNGITIYSSRSRVLRTGQWRIWPGICEYGGEDTGVV